MQWPKRCENNPEVGENPVCWDLSPGDGVLVEVPECCSCCLEPSRKCWLKAFTLRDPTSGFDSPAAGGGPSHAADGLTSSRSRVVLSGRDRRATDAPGEVLALQRKAKAADRCVLGETGPQDVRSGYDSSREKYKIACLEQRRITCVA